MRIDLNPSSLPEVERGRSTTGTSGKVEAGEQAARQSEDVAQLTTGSEAVATLKTQLSAIPDVRQDRVQSLRQAIVSGQYAISPDGIADRMLGADALRG